MCFPSRPSDREAPDGAGEPGERESLLGQQLSKDDAKKKQNTRKRNWLISGATTAVLAGYYFLRSAHSTAAAPQALQNCLSKICAGRDDCVHYDGPGAFNYYTQWMRPLNLAVDVTPVAVIRPRNAEEVSAVVKCAAQNNIKVQAKSGGHSYANYGLGGEDGAISVDLVNFQYVWVNTTADSWQAHIGAGGRLGDIDDELHKYGRAFAHGVCPGVGIGGHATIGGLGPMSRLWGSALDHIEEVEVVTADGSILRASTTQNSDLFFALRGAAAGFGIITEFVMRTHPEPPSVIQYTYNFQFSRLLEMVDFFEAWQNLIADPKLDRRLGTEFTLYPLGARVTATWYGTEAEFTKSGIMDRLPSGNDTIAINEETWFGSLLKDAQREALRLGDIPNPFYSKSLGLTRNDLLSRKDIIDLFDWVDNANKGTLAWFIIFDATGGKMTDTPTDATAYAHRDKVYFYQSYAINVLNVTSTTRAFISDFHENLLQKIPGKGPHGTYPGYIDPALGDGPAQREYWMSNLPRLEEIKAKWDPKDVFHNPQSVRPKKAKA
ncbi:FAD-linked oxidoreductase sord [Diplogelasinospora grovesii]|uniref:FAD-linked oxidoreductase sord n=1 Tax=Diplogelasinospora grovesii TaxID=303347 RepID=A0AAN6N7M6_9PEZI|nr:FAD-linked oxidoreductase sord [Diplogelasinospora grovesii]